MLKRETFVNAIRALRKQEELTEQMNQIYRQMTDGIGHFEMDGLAQNALLQTLKDGMDDEHGYVMWWLYEAPDDNKNVWWEENGQLVTIDLEDVNDLYDYLVHCAEERKAATK